MEGVRDGLSEGGMEGTEKDTLGTERKMGTKGNEIIRKARRCKKDMV